MVKGARGVRVQGSGINGHPTQLVGGEDRLSFDILNGRMAVAPGPVEVSPEAVLKAVARTGMRAEVWQRVSR